jgi:hypothetical protein
MGDDGQLRPGMADSMATPVKPGVCRASSARVSTLPKTCAVQPFVQPSQPTGPVIGGPKPMGRVGQRQ